MGRFLYSTRFAGILKELRRNGGVEYGVGHHSFYEWHQILGGQRPSRHIAPPESPVSRYEIHSLSCGVYYSTFRPVKSSGCNCWAGQAFSPGPRYKPMWLVPNTNMV
jgi:hypothetical protein